MFDLDLRSAAARGGALVAVLLALFALSGDFDPVRRLSVEADDPNYGSTPILRLNTPHHHSQIKRAATTRDGQWMVTVARDYTIRVWRTDVMEVAKTFYPPISNDYFDNPGSSELFAVDITADGSMIAAAGPSRSDGEVRVYVFNVTTGEMVASPVTAHGYVGDLAFSRDGRLLAVGVESQRDDENGLWVFETNRWREPMYRDRDYRGRESPDGGRIDGIAFGEGGVLVTTSYDGFLRRYADVREGADPVRVLVSDRGRASDVAISPDGAMVVVGYRNRPSGPALVPVSLHRNDAELSLIRAFENQLVPDDNGGSDPVTSGFGVSFSRDGSYFYASLAGNLGARVRGWSVGNLDVAQREYETCSDRNVIQILPHQATGAILVHADPGIDVVETSGQVRGPCVRGGRFVHFRQLSEQDPGLLYVSERGDEFHLVGRTPEESVSFDLTRRDLKRGPRPPSELQRLELPDNSRGAITLSDWSVSLQPRLNGRHLCIQHEQDAAAEEGDDNPCRRFSSVLGLSENRSYSADVSADGQFAVVSTNAFLQRYDANGAPLWPQPRYMPSISLRTNITPQGNAVLAYYQDGVMRWHDVNNGDVMLSLFVDRETSDWVMWTPDGYYDASPGADDLIGWHINHGRDQGASFEPASRYQDIFFSPERVDAAIESMRTGARLRRTQLDEQLVSAIRSTAPPTALISELNAVTRNNRPALNMGFVLRSPSGKPITGLRIRVDGSTRVEETRRLREGVVLRRHIPLYRDDRVVTVSAQTEDGWGTVAYAPAPRWANTRSAERGLTRVATAAPSRNRANVHALIVGVNDYTGSGLDNLDYAVTDAREFAAFLRRQQNTTYIDDTSDIVVLDGPNATAANINARLEELTQVGPDDIVVLFLAGHGARVGLDENQNYYFFPHGARADRPLSTLVSADNLVSAIELTRGRVFMFLDTCNANAAVHRGFYNRTLNLQKNVYIFASASENELSSEASYFGTGHGAFTFALLSALNGEADERMDGNRIVSTTELKSYLETEVPLLAARANNVQNPQMYAVGPNRRSLPPLDMFEVRRVE
jgi:hypothetical protein